MAKNSNLLRLSLTLFVITFVVAALLAIVNGITAPKIAESENKAINEALEVIFPGETFTEKEISEETAANGIRAVYQAGAAGYCINMTTKGYGGEINLLVGVDATGMIKDIQIISANETPGIGSKVLNNGYLSNYKGLAAPISFADKLAPVSGATISSKAVLAGVNKAVQAAEEAKANG